MFGLRYNVRVVEYGVGTDLSPNRRSGQKLARIAPRRLQARGRRRLHSDFQRISSGEHPVSLPARRQQQGLSAEIVNLFSQRISEYLAVAGHCLSPCWQAGVQDLSATDAYTQSLGR